MQFTKRTYTTIGAFAAITLSAGFVGCSGGDTSGGDASGDLEDTYTVDIQEMYVYEQAEGDEDSYVIDRDQLDLEPAIRDAVVMALPFSPSKDESEEFSFTVGEDLEVDESEADSPFASLKSLLDEKKES